MASIVQRYCPSFAWPKAGLASAKVAAYKTCKSAVSFLTDNRSAYLRAGAALVYDLWNWNETSISSSATALNLFLTYQNAFSSPNKTADKGTLGYVGLRYFCKKPLSFFQIACLACVAVFAQPILSMVKTEVLPRIEHRLIEDPCNWPALFGFKKFHGFEQCRNIHDFCEQVFPASRTRLPPDWQNSVKKIPKGEFLNRFEREAVQIGKCNPLREWAESLDKEGFSGSIQDLLRLMIHKSPLFARAWALANHPQKVNLKSMENSDTTGIHAAGGHSYYYNDTHTIAIECGGSYSVQLRNLIWETINALQRQEFQMIDALALCGKITREEYVLLNEWIESNCLKWCKKIFSDDSTNAAYWGLENQWEHINIAAAGAQVSHADHYRKDWDVRYSVPYFTHNPHVIAKFMKDSSIPGELSVSDCSV